MELEKKEKIEVNTFSSEVQDIIEATPSWPIRYGIVFFGIFLVVFFFFLNLISYPDLIKCRVVIISENPAIKLFSRESGQVQLLKKNRDYLKQGEEIALINSNSSYEDIKWLNEHLHLFKLLIKQNNLDQLSKIVRFDLVLGTLQSEYNGFLDAINGYINLARIDESTKKIATLEKQITDYKSLDSQLQLQLKLKEKEVSLIEKRYLLNKELLNAKVISEVDFENFEIQYLERLQSLEAMRDSKIRNLLTVAQVNERIEDVLINKNKRLYDIINLLELSIFRLESNIILWKSLHVIVAPVEGELNYLNFFDNDQFVEQGRAMFSITPVPGNIYATGFVPLEGSGKITPNQVALIRLDNFPAYEFGYINARVDKIGVIPENNLYTISLKLPDGLSTNFNKSIPFSPEMQGAVEIITNKKSILERIFGQLLQILKHQN